MNNDKKTDNNTEKFINHWRQYRGVQGFLRYIWPFMLGGLLLSPLILTWLNPNIWSQLHSSTFARSWSAVAFLVASFALLPALIVAMATWWNKNKRFMQLTTEQNRYLAFEKRLWRAQDKPWRVAISALSLLMGLSLFAAFWLLLGHNIPAHYAYPFETTLLFWLLYSLYSLFMAWQARHSDEALSIPAVFKVAFALSSISVGLAWFYLWQ